LSNIAVAAQWLETDPAKGKPLKKNEDIRQIAESATEGRERLTQFLALFDPQTAMIVPVDVESVASKLIAWLKKELTLRCIRVVWTVEKDLPEIRTDAAKLRHAIQNVLLNAVHAVKQYGEIRIELKREAGGVAMTVTDNGPGIPEADQEKIFEPLFTTMPDGTGLGLPVARDIVQSLGGSLILLQTTPDGTAFRFVLPLRACLTSLDQAR
jgi:signal transduction histidine kinase